MPAAKSEKPQERITRHISLNVENPEDYDSFEKIGKAFSSSIRIKMLDALKRRSMNLNEISEALSLPISSTSFHIKCLEDAGLIVTEAMPGIRGSQRVCSVCAEDISVTVNRNKAEEKHAYTLDMPIGNFCDCEIHPTCGIVDENGYIEVCDDPRVFYTPQRLQAQLIWFRRGFIEYRFPNHFAEAGTVRNLSFSLELCSEAPGYRNVWPSEITFLVNGLEICTYTVPGDFGGRHGRLTPSWWTDGNTQYGLLKTISFNHSGSYLDSVACEPGVTLEQLALAAQPFISFRIEIKPTARYIGGVNLFGDKFGDYQQNILMYAEF